METESARLFDGVGCAIANEENDKAIISSSPFENNNFDIVANSFGLCIFFKMLSIL
jgi:hypothetical protein